jgi:D-proline reductase (dithiol) PrdB
MRSKPKRHNPSDICNNPHYVHIENEFVPFTKLRKPLNVSKVSFVTMGGLYLEGQKPFEDIDDWGDVSFRELPKTLRNGEFHIAHLKYDHQWVNRDLNVLLPLSIFEEFEKEDLIGEIADTHYAFMGSIPDPLGLIVDTAPEVARRMHSQQVDIAILCST